MCDVDYGERADFWQDRQPVAREEHRCSECRMLIAPGTRYHRVFWVDQGSAGTYTCHLECHELVRYIAFDCCDQEVYLLGVQGLRERVAEHLGEGRVTSLYRQHVRARMAEGTWRAPRPSSAGST